MRPDFCNAFIFLCSYGYLSLHHGNPLIKLRANDPRHQLPWFVSTFGVMHENHFVYLLYSARRFGRFFPPPLLASCGFCT